MGIPAFLLNRNVLELQFKFLILFVQNIQNPLRNTDKDLKFKKLNTTGFFCWETWKHQELQVESRLVKALRKRGKCPLPQRNILNLRGDITFSLREHRLLLLRDTKATGTPAQAEAGRNYEKQRSEWPLPERKYINWEVTQVFRWENTGFSSQRQKSRGIQLLHFAPQLC